MLFPDVWRFRVNTIEKKLEGSGINLDTSYEDMPDADYWRIRNILIEEHPSFRDLSTSPPYTYDQREDKIMATIQSLLHRHLIQDVSILGKLFILIIWGAAFAAPWLLEVDMSRYLHQFGL
jgi:hypothetical protein